MKTLPFHSLESLTFSYFHFDYIIKMKEQLEPKIDYVIMTYDELHTGASQGQGTYLYKHRPRSASELKGKKTRNTQLQKYGILRNLL